MSEESFYEKRMEICNSCDKQWINFTTKICGECGCILPIKAAIKMFKCPLGKWDKEEEAND